MQPGITQLAIAIVQLNTQWHKQTVSDRATMKNCIAPCLSLSWLWSLECPFEFAPSSPTCFLHTHTHHTYKHIRETIEGTYTYTHASESNDTVCKSRYMHVPVHYVTCWKTRYVAYILKRIEITHHTSFLWSCHIAHFNATGHSVAKTQLKTITRH